MLVVLPLLAAFLLMVTGISYQFQGWLAALMVNKRRRGDHHHGGEPRLCRPLPAAEHGEFPVAWAEPEQVRTGQEQTKGRQQVFNEVRKHDRAIANMVLPPGWLPLGAMAAAEGSIGPPCSARWAWR